MNDDVIKIANAAYDKAAARGVKVKANHITKRSPRAVYIPKDGMSDTWVDSCGRKYQRMENGEIRRVK